MWLLELELHKSLMRWRSACQSLMRNLSRTAKSWKAITKRWWCSILSNYREFPL